MRKLKILLISLPVLFFTTGYMLMDENALARIIMKALAEYESLEEASPKTREDLDSWLPEQGIRSKYAYLKSIAGKEILEAALGMNIFLSGPHEEDINYYSNEMGHYNPEFVSLLHATLEELFEDAEFRENAQILYDRKFQSMARSYYGAYAQFGEGLGLEDEKSNYLWNLNREQIPQYYWSNRLYYFNGLWERKGYDVLECHVAGGFWVRRYIDGTHQQFLDLLRLVLKHLDPEFYRGIVLSTDIPKLDEALANPQEVQELELYGKLHGNLHPRIGELENLQFLGLNNNGLSVLPDELGSLTHLIGIDLRNNKFEAFPTVLTKLDSLWYLNLNDNQLQEIPREISAFSQLEGLGLKNNALTGLPPEIGMLTCLQVLKLDRNKLSRLPEEIGQLKSLEELDLSFNELVALPEEIGQLNSLIELKLSANKLPDLPDEIGQLQSLSRLSLPGNPLSEIPAGVFELKNLSYLNLSVTDLREVPAEISKLTNLTGLVLSGNPITHLPEEIRNLKKLKLLSLYETKISEEELRRITSWFAEGVVEYQ